MVSFLPQSAWLHLVSMILSFLFIHHHKRFWSVMSNFPVYSPLFTSLYLGRNLFWNILDIFFPTPKSLLYLRLCFVIKSSLIYFSYQGICSIYFIRGMKICTLETVSKIFVSWFYFVKLSNLLVKDKPRSLVKKKGSSTIFGVTLDSQGWWFFSPH